MNRYAEFLRDDAGTVTADWVVLTVSVLALGIMVVYSTISDGVSSLDSASTPVRLLVGRGQFFAAIQWIRELVSCLVMTRWSTCCTAIPDLLRLFLLALSSFFPYLSACSLSLRCPHLSRVGAQRRVIGLYLQRGHELGQICTAIRRWPIRRDICRRDDDLAAFSARPHGKAPQR